jgi:four helix bundle protein
MATFKELLVYKKSFDLAMQIQNIKGFPKEEQYSLTDQVRRSSRSVCVNLAEGFRKLRYKAHFIAKMSDADMENTETQVWIDFSFSFGHITKAESDTLLQQSEEIGRLLNHIIENPEKYGAK